jgi:hypothetical protein
MLLLEVSRLFELTPRLLGRVSITLLTESLASKLERAKH